MIKEKIKSCPFNLIYLFLPYTILVIFCDLKVFIEPLYEFISEGDVGKFMLAFLLFVLPPDFLLILMLLYLSFSRVYINNYGIYVKFLFKTHIIPWERVKNCYWKEAYCTSEGDFSYCLLIIETSEKEIRLGPEWTNREMLMKYIQKEIRQRNRY